MKEALGELEDELDSVEELIDEPSGGEREERGMEALMYGEDFGGIFHSQGGGGAHEEG